MSRTPADPHVFSRRLPTQAGQRARAELLGAAKGAYNQTRHMLDSHQARMPTLRVSAASSGPSTLYFLVPDFERPAGGIRVMYRHVDLLNEAGVPSAVLHRRRGFRCTWFPNETQVKYIADTELAPHDVLVVPDVYAPLMPDLPTGLQHLLFDQSGGHLSLRRHTDRLVEHVKKSPDLLGILTVSTHSQDLLQHIFPTRRIHRVHLSVDPSLFFLEPSSDRAGIVYLKRRGAVDAENALRVLQARDGLRSTPTASLNDMSQLELARTLRSTSIFLHLPYQEGFGLPAVEAMACGAYVLGYHGYGGREFMLPTFSSTVETGDLLGLVKQLEAALIKERDDPGWLADRGQEAAAFIADHYRPERERTEVLTAYQEVTQSHRR